MSTGSFLNTDGLLQQYGTQKANPEQGGDYRTPAGTRYVEVLIDLKSLTTTSQVQSLTTFFPAGYNVFVEQVELIAEEASAGGTSFSVGLGYFSGSTYATITTRSESSTSSAIGTTSYSASVPGITSISDTAFVSALVNASTNTLGDKITMTVGSSSVGGYVGAQSTTTTQPNYITAKCAGTYTAGLIRVRIFYRGYGTIIN